MGSRAWLCTFLAAAAFMSLLPALMSLSNTWPASGAPSAAHIQLSSFLGVATAETRRSKANATQVLKRMQYWNRWDATRPIPSSKGPEKFLMFDHDQGGLNNRRIAWEVAAAIAFATGRTLVLPMPKEIYLIDFDEKIKPGEERQTSKMEDFLNMDQLKKGVLRTKTPEDFANTLTGKKELEASMVVDMYTVAKEMARAITGNSTALCDLSSWRVEDKVVHAKWVSYEDGRLFACSAWWELGHIKFVEKGVDFRPSLQLLSELHGGFVWHPDVFEMASLIVQDLGLFEYTSLHLRYQDFSTQFAFAHRDPSWIVDTWFMSDMGQRIMQNTTGVYISTDDTTGMVMKAFREKGIQAKSSSDYWNNVRSPIFGLTQKWGKRRTEALKGPVEQLVCAFGRLFIGTDRSTFTGYISQMRINADAPQTISIFRTDMPTEALLAEVAATTSEWKARGGAENWKTASAELDLLRVQGFSEAKRAKLQQRRGSSEAKGSRGLTILWDARGWVALLLAPALLWTATSPNTGPMAITVCYVTASIGMNILSKEAATTFNATFLLVIIQMVFASLVIMLMEGHNMMWSRWEDILRWSMAPLFFAGMLATSMWAMREASLSAVLILKNMLPIMSSGAEIVLFNTPSSITTSMALSLLLTFFGTMLYAFSDASVSNLGKLLVLVNTWFTMIDRLVQTYYLELSNDFTISVPLCVLLNNTMGVLPMLALAIASGEVPEWKTAVSQATSSTWMWVVLSSSCGACLGYVSLRMQQLVSGKTVLALQHFSKMLLIALSVTLFGDRLQPLSWVGCAISIGSCCWYTALRLPAETKDASSPMRKH